MKITICGSTAFILEMEAVKNLLENLGHEVKMPPVTFTDGDGKVWHTVDYYKFKKTQPFDDPAFLNNHTQRIQDHFDKVAWSDVVVITNYDKNNIPGYIGPNTLIEMGLAFHLKKPIYLLNDVPETAWKEEILGLKPKVIKKDLKKIL